MGDRKEIAVGCFGIWKPTEANRVVTFLVYIKKITQTENGYKVVCICLNDFSEAELIFKTLKKIDCSVGFFRGCYMGSAVEILKDRLKKIKSPEPGPKHELEKKVTIGWAEKRADTFLSPYIWNLNYFFGEELRKDVRFQ